MELFAERPKKGWRVMMLGEHTSIARLGVDPILDVITEPLEDLERTLVDRENTPTELVFYNLARAQYWRGIIVPRKWKGRGLLGAEVVLELIPPEHFLTIQVVNVKSDSPLDKASINKLKDYILPADDVLFADVPQFQDYFLKHQDIPVNLHVYNIDCGAVRTVKVTATSKWGGPGLLGGEVRMAKIPVSRAREGKERLKELISCGFPEAEAIPALIKSEGDPQSAAEQILYSRKPESFVFEKENLRCKIDYLEPVSVVLVPCGHALCDQCAAPLSICPFCRKNIQSKIKLHFS